MTSPLVSIIVATYRRSDVLLRALHSVCSQTYNNCEIIVVDDNDNSQWNDLVLQIVDECSVNYTIPIEVIQNHPNLGSAASRNIGIERASGTYIAFLDDDDVYLSQRIEHQLTTMIDNDADYGITDLSLYYDDESLCEIRKRTYLDTLEGKNLLLCHLKYHMTGTDTLMFKKEYLTRLGGFGTVDSGDEYYLMMKAIQNGGTLNYLAVCDVKAYVHTNEHGLSSGQGKIDGENVLYQYKTQFFNDLNNKDIRYIKMRHHAVLAFAYLRSKKTGHFFSEGIKAFLASPFGCLQLISSLK